MTPRELRNFAKTNKIRGYAKYSKRVDLLNFLLNHPQGDIPENQMTLFELKALARQMAIPGRSKLTNKKALKEAIERHEVAEKSKQEKIKNPYAAAHRFVASHAASHQSKKKQTRREKRDKKNFVASPFNEELPQVNQEKRLKRLKKVWPPSTKKEKEKEKRTQQKTFHGGTIPRKKSKN